MFGTGELYLDCVMHDLRKMYSEIGQVIPCYSRLWYIIYCVWYTVHNLLRPVHFINPRRACARVTVLGLCVCPCVCVSVCLSVRHHESCHYAQRSVQPKVPTVSAQAGKHFKYGVFSKNALFKSYGVKKPTSLVCAYCDIIWRRWSDISPEISKKVLFWF